MAQWASAEKFKAAVVAAAEEGTDLQVVAESLGCSKRSVLARAHELAAGHAAVDRWAREHAPRRPAPAPRGRRRDDVDGPLARMAADGATVAEAAEALGVSASTVRSRARELGLSMAPVPRGPRPRTLDADQERMVRRMLAEGATHAQCAAAVGVSSRTLAKMAERAGGGFVRAPRREPKRRWSIKEAQRVARLLPAQGLPSPADLMAAADALGRPVADVAEAWRAMASRRAEGQGPARRPRPRPGSRSGRPWAPWEDRVILEEAGAGPKATTRGLQAAAARLGRTVNEVAERRRAVRPLV